MSRKTTVCNNGNLAVFGLDHALGWFYEEYDKEGNQVKDLCSVFDNLSKGKLIELLEETDTPKEVKVRIALDTAP